jgi:hypothetical protein
MTDDLVKRLRRRTLPTDMGGLTVYDEDPMCHEAADRIEALEKALLKISSVGDEAIPSPTGNLSQEAASLWVCLAMCVDVARAALGEKKDAER